MGKGNDERSSTTGIRVYVTHSTTLRVTTHYRHSIRMKNIQFKIILLFSVLIIGLSGFTQKSTPKETTVYVFLSESCPICQSYTLTLKKLYTKYSNKNVKFIGVFPNYYADSDSVNTFKKKYSIPFDLILDKNGALTKRFGAKITPEVFVENATHDVLYSGRIDDSFYALGKRRNVITSNDLDNVLDEITTHKNIKTSKTQAVGCIINLSE